MSLSPADIAALPALPATPKTNPMKIECIITCVSHADFLAHTLPLNKPHFDRIIVITAPEDKATQKICDYWGVRYHATDAFQARWGHFCKGTAINEGLALLDKDAWICHMDADVILPPNTRIVLERADLDTTMIYGIDRVMCPNYTEWQRFIGAPQPHTEGNGFFINTTHSPFPLGTRVAFEHHGGWIPVGFFQLFHADSNMLTYPEGHTDAGREDAVFPTQWPRRKRGFIPEITAYHLESEPAAMATNWQKRVTKPFSVDSIKA
jgi:hypothetical protein